jgi:TonB-dependent receptor
MSFFKRINLFTLIVLLANTVSSQNGTISGKVFDKETSETIIGATIRLLETDKGTVSDINGDFKISNIPQGDYSLEVRFVSYNTFIVKSVIVKPNEQTKVSISLSPSTIGLEEVEIVATAEKSSNVAMIAMQRNSAAITNNIGAEDIKKSSDNNSAQVIKRIPGVTIQEGKFAIIRGLADRYNFAVLNGHPLPSTEADRKTFSFDIFPSSIVENISVSKSSTPDMPAEFAGGIIQINTKNVTDEPFVNVSISGSYNDLATFKPYSNYQGGKNDFLGFDDGTRALPNDFPSTDEIQQSQRDEAIEYAKLLENNWEVKENKSATPNLGFQVSAGKNFQINKNQKLGLVAALSFSNSNNNLSVVRKDFDLDKTSYEYEDKQYSTEVLAGALLNVSYQLAKNHQISFKNTFSQHSLDQTIQREGININGNQLRKSTAFLFNFDKINIHQAVGNHYLSKSKINLEWAVSYTQIFSEIPDFRRVMYTRNAAAPDNIPFRAQAMPNVNPDMGGRFFSELNEYSNNYSASATIPFKILGNKNSFKTGFHYNNRRRDFNARVIGYVIAPPTFQFDFNLLTLPPEQLFAQENMRQGGFMIGEITNPSDRYGASVNHFSTYAMLENRITKKLKLIWGARLEQFNQKLSSEDYSGNIIDIDTTYFNIFPSANLNYEINDISNIRFSSYQTTSRPEFRELAPFSFYDFSSNFIILGNPNITATQIFNLDLRYEIYPKLNEMFSVAVFYKNFTNPIEQVIDPSSGFGSLLMTYDNIDRAENFGAELELRKSFGFITPNNENSILNNFYLNMNLAYISSLVDMRNVPGAPTDFRPLQGQSPYIINTGISFKDKSNKTEITAMYNRIGRRIFRVGFGGYPDIYENPRDIFDIGITRKIGKNLEIRAATRDIFANRHIFYQDISETGDFTEGDNEILSMNAPRIFTLQLNLKF